LNDNERKIKKKQLPKSESTWQGKMSQPKASLFNKSAILGVTKFITIIAMMLVTLCCAA
jgi:hypothetical protein